MRWGKWKALPVERVSFNHLLIAVDSTAKLGRGRRETNRCAADHGRKPEGKVGVAPCGGIVV